MAFLVPRKICFEAIHNSYRIYIYTNLLSPHIIEVLDLKTRICSATVARDALPLSATHGASAKSEIKNDAKMRKKGVSTVAVVGVIGVVIVLLLGAYLTGVLVPTAAPPIIGTPDQPTVTIGKCQDDGTNSLFAAARNPVNATLEYLSQNFNVIGDNEEVVATGTGTGGSTLTYTTVNIPCSAGAYFGTVIGLMTAAHTSGEGEYAYDLDTADTVVINSGVATRLKIAAFRTDLGTNTTNRTTDDTYSGPQAGGGCYLLEGEFSSFGGTTVGTGESWSRYVDFKANESSSQFGSTIEGKPGMAIVVDGNDTAYTEGDIRIAEHSGGGNLQKVDCSDEMIDDAVRTVSGDECYTMDGITSKDITRRIRIDGTASVGDPARNVKLVFMDMGWIEDTDGSIVWRAQDSGGTNVGVINCILTIDIN